MAQKTNYLDLNTHKAGSELSRNVRNVQRFEYHTIEFSQTAEKYPSRQVFHVLKQRKMTKQQQQKNEG